MRTGTSWGAALAVSAVLTAFGGGALAQNAAGDWHGTLTAADARGAGSLRLGVTLKAKAGGGYEGSLTSVDQGGAVFALDQAKVESGTLSFSIPAIKVSYSGRWDAARKAWVGTWNPGAMTLALTAGEP